MRRYGALVKFRPGVSRAAAEAALDKIRPLLEESLTYPNGYRKPPVPAPAPVEEYDDDHGGPVWYIP